MMANPVNPTAPDDPSKPVKPMTPVSGTASTPAGNGAGPTPGAPTPTPMALHAPALAPLTPTGTSQTLPMAQAANPAMPPTPAVAPVSGIGTATSQLNQASTYGAGPQPLSGAGPMATQLNQAASLGAGPQPLSGGGSAPSSSPAYGAGTPAAQGGFTTPQAQIGLAQSLGGGSGAPAPLAGGPNGGGAAQLAQLGQAQSLGSSATPAAPSTYGAGTPATQAYQASSFGQQQANSGTAGTLAQMAGAGGATGKSAGLGLADMQNGYNANESQAQLSARHGQTINPLTGAYDDPSTRGPGNTGPSTYNFDAPNNLGGGAGTLMTQSLNGGPTTGPNGAPLPSAPGTPSIAPLGGPAASAAPGQPGTPSIAPLGGAPSSPPGTPNGVGLSQVNPDADLRSQQVLPTNAVDRNQLTTDRMKNYESQLLPQLQADVRAKTQGAAGMGRIGSGMLRTDVGNLDLAAENNLNQHFSDLTSNATEGSINDAANTRNEYRQERGYQTGQEQNAYDRGVQGVTLQDALTNSAFGRGMQQQIAGQGNNPAQTQMLLSQIFGQQATGAGQALSGMVSGNAANGQLQQMLNQQGQQGGQTDPSQLYAQFMAYMKARGGGPAPVGGDAGGVS